MAVVFALSTIAPSAAQAQALTLPAPGQMVALSQPFNPPLLKGLKVDPVNPFRFEFILDSGDLGNEGRETRDEGRERGNEKTMDEESSNSKFLSSFRPSFSVPSSPSVVHRPSSLVEDSARLIRYFLASVTVPEQDLWVNLSPYEKDRIVTDAFGQTEMGRDLLAQDYILKQITASVIYPDSDIGKKFWDRVYAEARRRYGTTDVPVDTFNKVWIIPETAVVQEQGNTAVIAESRLKVMLETDYLASQKQEAGSKTVADSDSQALARDILRQIIIPILEQEVNTGANFATLRQVYHSLILASWYKQKVKASILGRVYADRRKVKGLESEGHRSYVISHRSGWQRVEGEAGRLETRSAVDRTAASSPYDLRPMTYDLNPNQIWSLYVEAFKKGAYNFIREELDPGTEDIIPRKYFSGGTALQLKDTLKVQPVDLAQMPAIRNASLIEVVASPVKDAAMDTTAEPDQVDLVERLSRSWGQLRELKQYFVDYFKTHDIEVPVFRRDALIDLETEDFEAYASDSPTPFSTDHLAQLVGYGTASAPRYRTLFFLISDQKVIDQLQNVEFKKIPWARIIPDTQQRASARALIPDEKALKAFQAVTANPALLKALRSNVGLKPVRVSQEGLVITDEDILMSITVLRPGEVILEIVPGIEEYDIRHFISLIRKLAGRKGATVSISNKRQNTYTKGWSHAFIDGNDVAGFLRTLPLAEGHVHFGSSVPVDALWTIALERTDIDWQPVSSELTEEFKQPVDVQKLLDEARQALAQGKPNEVERLKEQFASWVTFQLTDKSDLKRFTAMYRFIGNLTRGPNGLYEEIARKVALENYRSGVRLLVQRVTLPLGSTEEEIYQRTLERANAIRKGFAQAESEVNGRNGDLPFESRLVFTVEKRSSLETLILQTRALLRVLREHPELTEFVVGFDAADYERLKAPTDLVPLFDQIDSYNTEQKAAGRPTLAITFHAGEDFKHVSMEGSIRQVEQAVEMGASAIGHALVLGVDPQIFFGKEKSEEVGERVAQIFYDLKNSKYSQDELAAVDLPINEEKLWQELQSLARTRPLLRDKVLPLISKALAGKTPDPLTDRQVYTAVYEMKTAIPGDTVTVKYDAARIEEVRKRQRLVLNRLIERDIVIEVNPTANIILGPIRDYMQHPLVRLLAFEYSGPRRQFAGKRPIVSVNTDNPSIFKTNLFNEYVQIALAFGLTADDLTRLVLNGFVHRLGRFPSKYGTDFERVTAVPDPQDAAMKAGNARTSKELVAGRVTDLPAVNVAPDMQRPLKDVRNVGLDKLIGYLPLRTIGSQQLTGELIAEARAKGLSAKIHEGGETLDSLFVYDRPALQHFLDQEDNQRVIQISAGVPSTADGFVDFIAKHHISERQNPALHRLIAQAFANPLFSKPVLDLDEIKKVVEREYSGLSMRPGADVLISKEGKLNVGIFETILLKAAGLANQETGIEMELLIAGGVRYLLSGDRKDIDLVFIHQNGEEDNFLYYMAFKRQLNELLIQAGMMSVDERTKANRTTAVMLRNPQSGSVSREIKLEPFFAKSNAGYENSEELLLERTQRTLKEFLELDEAGFTVDAFKVYVAAEYYLGDLARWRVLKNKFAALSDSDKKGLREFFDNNLSRARQLLQMSEAEIKETLLQRIGTRLRIALRDLADQAMVRDAETVPKPSGPATIEEAGLKAWAESPASTEVKDIRRKIVQHVMGEGYVTQALFESRLKETTEDLNAVLARSGEPYAVLFDPHENKSKRWVYSLARQWLVRPPADIFYRWNADASVRAGIRDIVIFDDAIFSGDQLRGILSEFVDRSRIKERMRILVAVPFITQEGELKLKHFAEEAGVEVRLLKHQRIATIGELLSADEREFLATRSLSLPYGEALRRELTCTFFDHRIPDDRSFYQDLIKFIKVGPKPYAKAAEEASAYTSQEAFDRYLDDNASESDSFFEMLAGMNKGSAYAQARIAQRRNLLALVRESYRSEMRRMVSGEADGEQGLDLAMTGQDLKPAVVQAREILRLSREPDTTTVEPQLKALIETYLSNSPDNSGVYSRNSLMRDILMRLLVDEIASTPADGRRLIRDALIEISKTLPWKQGRDEQLAVVIMELRRNVAKDPRIKSFFEDIVEYRLPRDVMLQYSSLISHLVEDGLRDADSFTADPPSWQALEVHAGQIEYRVVLDSVKLVLDGSGSEINQLSVAYKTVRDAGDKNSLVLDQLRAAALDEKMTIPQTSIAYQILRDGEVIFPDGSVQRNRMLGRFRLVELLLDWISADRLRQEGFLLGFSDQAQVSEEATPTGGIDLTSANAVTVQNDGGGITFDLDPAMIQQLETAAGFTPVIINVRPMMDLRQFLESP